MKFKSGKGVLGREMLLREGCSKGEPVRWKKLKRAKASALGVNNFKDAKRRTALLVG